MAKLIQYQAEPIAAKFHNDASFFRGLMGPIGSGKSVACITEIWRNAHEQLPSPDGIRRTRWAIIRNTYPELLTTTLKSWIDWVPEDICPVNRSAPITARLKAPLDDGTSIDLEVLFLALDKPQDVKKLLSLELTGVFINEAREVPKAVVDGATSRVGRYPNKSDGGPTRACVIADTNPPDDDHWWYRLGEEETPSNWRFFRQPGALTRIETFNGIHYEPNPEAQNVQNLPGGYSYYLNQLGGKTEEWIKVYILGQYGTVEDGRPVYQTTWNDRLHVAGTNILPNPKFPLLLGWDFGLTPACIICQFYPSGRFAVIEELVAEYSGIKQFGRDVVRPHLMTHYKGYAIGASVGDPAGMSASQTDETTCIDILNTTFEDGGVGIPTSPSPSNSLVARLDAVNHFLTKLVDANPAFYLSPKCTVLRKGFNGGYKFNRIQVLGDERFKDVPDKNRFSHPHDALQYACQGALSGMVDFENGNEIYDDFDSNQGRSSAGGY